MFEIVLFFVVLTELQCLRSMNVQEKDQTEVRGWNGQKL